MSDDKDALLAAASDLDEAHTAIVLAAGTAADHKMFDAVRALGLAAERVILVAGDFRTAAQESASEEG